MFVCVFMVFTKGDEEARGQGPLPRRHTGRHLHTTSCRQGEGRAQALGVLGADCCSPCEARGTLTSVPVGTGTTARSGRPVPSVPPSSSGWLPRSGDGLPGLAAVSGPTDDVRHRARESHPRLGPLCPRGGAALLAGGGGTLAAHHATATA